MQAEEKGLQFSLLSLALITEISSWQLERELLEPQFSEEVGTDPRDQLFSLIRRPGLGQIGALQVSDLAREHCINPV